MQHSYILWALWAFTCALAIRGDSVALMPAADTTLFETNPDSNLGGASTVVVGTTEQFGKKSRALFRFNGEGKVPAGSVVTNVQLVLELLDVPQRGGSASVFKVHRLLKPWGEGVKTDRTGAAASPGEATWKARFAPATLWSAPGGLAANDFLAQESSSTKVSGLGSYTFASTSNLVADVQGWLENPTNNFGWIVISDSENTRGTARRFASREDTKHAPFLLVKFAAPRLPRIDQVERMRNDLILHFTAEAGNSYAIQYRDSLSPPRNWSTLSTFGSKLVTTNIAIVDSNSTNAQRFYRIAITGKIH